MKSLKTLPVFALLLALALSACAPTTAVPEQQTPIVNETVPAAETPQDTPALPTGIIESPAAETETVETPTADTPEPETPTAETQQVPGTGATPAPDFSGDAAFIELFEALSGAEGITVEHRGAIEQPFFDVEAQILSIDGEQVQVFEFNSVTDRQEAQDLISATGATIGDTNLNFAGTPHFWASGRLLVLYVGDDGPVIELLTGLLGQQITNPPGTIGTPLPPSAAIRAQQYLADLLGANIDDVEFISFDQQQWPDACLGLPQANENCAQVITPGWQVTLRVNGQLYQLRTDQTGSQVRAAQGQQQ